MSQHIRGFSLEDTLLFKDLHFQIPKGLSVVYGLNRTNGKKSMQANGAGKSSAFAAIGETLYEEPIVGLKEDTIKQGKRTVRLQLGKKRVDVVRKNTKLEILVNGRPKEFRKKSDGREWLRKNLPMSQAEFNTYGFLDARVPHPLVMGTSTERKRFFTEAFGLDKIDVERRLFEAELSQLKRVRTAYKELKAVFDADKARALPKEERLKLLARKKKYEAELEELQAKHVRLQDIMRLLAFEETAGKKLRQFDAICPDLEDYSQLFKDTQANLRDNKAKLRDAQAWAEYQRDSRKYTKAYAALSDEAKALIDKLGFGKARKRCKDAATELSEIEVTIESHERYLSDFDMKKPAKPEEERPDANKKELRARLESLEHKLEHALKFKTGTCDSCGQDVKVRDPKELKRKAKEVSALLELIDLWDEYDTQRAEYKEFKAKRDKIEAELPDLKAQRKRLKGYKSIGAELRELPEEPEPFTGKKLEVEVCEQMVEEDRKQLELLEFIDPNIDHVHDLRKLTDKQRNAAAVGPKLNERINELHEKLSSLKARLEVNRSVTDGLQKMKDRLLEMRAELINEEPLKLLVKAYSDKAMKRMAIKSVSTKLMQEINKYAKLIFPEDFDFGFSWESSKISLTVTRKYRQGKKVKTLTSDVRKLSGAESKLYTFILVLAHLTFVPARKRSNVLILDEPDSNMSAETSDAFKKLLPILNKVIPSIIVITPRTEQRYEGAQEFTVLKEKGEAKIVSGHPSTIR
jgi:DNA repair exonuclease SbcCD ATPase subunit